MEKTCKLTIFHDAPPPRRLMAERRKLRIDEIEQHRVSPHSVHAATRLPVAGMLDNIRSLYNVGSIFRTADGVLLDHLYLTGYTPAPPRKEIDKTALGAVTSIPWSHHRDPLEAIGHARARGMTICLLEQTTDSIPFDAVPVSAFPLCLVVGNELAGISTEIVKRADMAVEIPMVGTKHSLNAAVAFGIAVFTLARIWRSSAGVISDR